ncbi:MAG: hypothetical protein ABSE49_35770 [Polyangiaceae bacterium]|jgi:hypothetical protein
MGAEFHRLVMAAMAAGLLVIPGCGAGDSTSTGKTAAPPAVTAQAAPTITKAALVDGNSLQVTFSTAVAPVNGVDPAKFRLTVAYFTRPATATGKYSYQYYSGSYHNSYYGSQDHTVYSDVGDPTAVVNDPAATDQAIIALGSTFNPATACQQIKAFNAANSNAQAGLYLHYSSAGSPTIEDTNGDKVASLAAYWATDPTIEQISGDFTGKPIPVAITCN